MTVAQLRRLLEDLPDELQVLLADDTSFGTCSPLDEVFKGCYEPADDEEHGAMRTLYRLHHQVDVEAQALPVNAVVFYPAR